MALSAAAQQSLAFALGVNGNALAQELVDAINGITALPSGNIIVGNASGVATDTAMSGDITISNTGVTAIGAGKVTNAMVSPASLDGTVAAVSAFDAVIGALPLLFRITIAAGALAAKNVVMTHKVRVLDAFVVLEGAGVANTVLVVGNGATAITDTMAVSGAQKALVRAATIDSAAQDIAAAGSLRVTTSVGATQPACSVYVWAVRVA